MLENKLMRRVIMLAFIAALAVPALMAGRVNGKGKPSRGGDPAIACVRWHSKSGSLEDALMVMDADGSNQAIIYREKAPKGHIGYAIGRPSWSPDGTKIAFARFYDGGIFTIGVDGSGLVRLTPSPSGENQYDRKPAWSPDGSEIAYRSWDGHIHIIDADGTNDTKLSVTGDSPTWAPSGDEIAYVSEGDLYLYRYDPETGITHVTDSGVPDGAVLSAPDWARTDSNKIAVCVWGGEGTDVDIWVIDLSDPNETTNITDSSLTSELYPAWSPDDVDLVFQRGSTGADRFYLASSVDGTGETLLAEYPTPKRWLWSGLRTPAWRR